MHYNCKGGRAFDPQKDMVLPHKLQLDSIHIELPAHAEAPYASRGARQLVVAVESIGRELFADFPFRAAEVSAIGHSSSAVAALGVERDFLLAKVRDLA